MALSDEISAHAVYVNGHAHARAHMRHEDLVEYEADMAKAKAAMERAWLEAKPTLAAGGALTADGNAEPPLPRPFDPEIGWTTSQPDGW